MRQIRRLMLTTLVLALGSATFTPVAAADDVFDLSVSRVSAEYSRTALAEDRDQYFIRLESQHPRQEVLALSLSPFSRPAPDETYTVTSPEQVDSADWRPIYYLSSHFGVIDNRIRDSHHEVKVGSERSAYQLAVWGLSGHARPRALPAGAVASRAADLMAIARAASVSSKDPSPARAHIEIDEIQKYLSGNKLRIALRGSDEPSSGLPNQLVTVSVNGQPRNAQVTDDSGNAEVSLPATSSDYLGTVTAQWQSKLPPGTFLRSSSGDWVVLVGSSPIIVTQQKSYTNSTLGSKKEVGTVLATLAYRYVNRYLPAGVVFALCGLAILVVAFGLSSRVKNAKGRAFVSVIAAGLVLCLVGAYFMAKAQDKEFDVSWADTGSGTEKSLTVENVLGSSKRESSRYKTAYNWPCVVDDDRTTPWISAPEQGPPETVALDLGSTSQINSLELTLGWPDADFDYRETGQPSIIQLIGETGQIDQVKLEPREWEEWRNPLKVDLRSSSRTPIQTRVLYLRVISIVGGVKTNFGIADIKLSGFEVGDEGQLVVGSDALTKATHVRSSHGCGFQN